MWQCEWNEKKRKKNKRNTINEIDAQNCVGYITTRTHAFRKRLMWLYTHIKSHGCHTFVLCALFVVVRTCIGSWKNSIVIFSFIFSLFLIKNISKWICESKRIKMKWNCVTWTDAEARNMWRRKNIRTNRACIKHRIQADSKKSLKYCLCDCVMGCKILLEFFLTNLMVRKHEIY